MIRTQETAFYMLAEKIEKPINIFPHIGEKGMGIDNIGLGKERQCEIISKQNLKIIINYSTIFVTTPAPTVRPPSRIANRIPFSIAIGQIN